MIIRLKKKVKACLFFAIIGLTICLAIVSSKTRDAICEVSNGSDSQLLLLTVASKDTINLRRLVRSAHVNGIPIKVLGLGRLWKGLGQKIAYLKEELQCHYYANNKIIMFADAYDSLINARANEIVRKFQEMNVRILFSAELNCFPDSTFCAKYPPSETGKKYLNSGLFIGYAPELYRLLTISTFPEEAIDQQYFTEMYIQEQVRRELNFTLDYNCQVFQTIEDDSNNIDIRFEGRTVRLYNRDFRTTPLAVHTPGYFKGHIDNFAYFIPNEWNPIDGCTACLENTFDLSRARVSEFPRVIIVVFIEAETPNIESFLRWLEKLDYPGKKIHLIIYNAINNYTGSIMRFQKEQGRKYCSITIIDVVGYSDKSHRNSALEECIERTCDFYLSVDSSVYLNAHALRHLVEQNRTVVAPLLYGPDRKTNNFFSSHKPMFSIPNFTKASSKKRRGLWHVVALWNCYLVRGDVIRNPKTKPSYSYLQYQDPDMAFSTNLKNSEVDLYLSNREDFGHLVTPGKAGTCAIFSCGKSPQEI